MTTYIIVSLLSFLAGIFLYAKFGAVAISDFIKLEASLKAEITALKNHITTKVNTAKADAAKVEATAAKVITDVKSTTP